MLFNSIISMSLPYAVILRRMDEAQSDSRPPSRRTPASFLATAVAGRSPYELVLDSGRAAVSISPNPRIPPTSFTVNTPFCSRIC